MFFTTSHVFFPMPYFPCNYAENARKVRTVCRMLVSVKKRMNFAHVQIKRNVLTNSRKLNIDLVLRDLYLWIW